MPDTTRIHKPLYRVFHLNRTGGIDRAEIVEAIDDEDAIGRVHGMAVDHAVELWDRARFIAKVEPPLSAREPHSVVVRVELDAIAAPVGFEGVIGEQKLVH